MKRLHIHLAPDHTERLKQAAHARGVTVAELIRRAVEAYLNGLDGANGGGKPRRRGGCGGDVMADGR